MEVFRLIFFTNSNSSSVLKFIYVFNYSWDVEIAVRNLNAPKHVFSQISIKANTILLGFGPIDIIVELIETSHLSRFERLFDNKSRFDRLEGGKPQAGIIRDIPL